VFRESSCGCCEDGSIGVVSVDVVDIVVLVLSL
jgi:hypothetical protein